MKKLLKSFVLVVFTLPQVLNAGSPPPGNVLPDIIEKVEESVVNISSLKLVKQWVVRGMPEFFGMLGIPEEHIEKQSSLGSGFLIDGEGYLLTNAHVIDQASEVYVTFSNKQKIKAKIIGKDKPMDLALLQLTGFKEPIRIKPVTFGNSSALRKGESVFAIGNPFGLDHSVSAGIISSKNRSIGLGPYDDLLQTDTSINPGNSGGPLFNMKGEVVGINTAIAPQGQNIGFAIPIDEAKSALSDLKKYGFVVRPWLGILGQPITPALQDDYELPVENGVIILNLVARGPALKAGLKVGDIITKIQNQEVKSPGDIQRELSKLKPNEQYKISFVRKGKKGTADLQAVPAPNLNDERIPKGIL